MKQLPPLIDYMYIERTCVRISHRLICCCIIMSILIYSITLVSLLRPGWK